MTCDLQHFTYYINVQVVYHPALCGNICSMPVMLHRLILRLRMYIGTLVRGLQVWDINLLSLLNVHIKMPEMIYG